NQRSDPFECSLRRLAVLRIPGVVATIGIARTAVLLGLVLPRIDPELEGRPTPDTTELVESALEPGREGMALTGRGILLQGHAANAFEWPLGKELVPDPLDLLEFSFHLARPPLRY